MITYQTNREFPIYGDRSTLLGNYIIYMRVDSLCMRESDVNVMGYYYYIKDGSITILDNFNLSYTWDMIEYVENGMNLISETNLKEAVLKRITDFSKLRLMIEDGVNYSTVLGDWMKDGVLYVSSPTTIVQTNSNI